MERLPPGHPSSPYNDDGSPKPALPDLSDYELPIPGDPDYRPEPSGASEAYGSEPGQTSEHVTQGINLDEGPETTTDRPELWEAQSDVDLPTDEEYAGHAEEARERPDQVWAWDAAPDEEDTPGVRDEVSQEEREALHEAPADDLNERAANELPVARDPHYQPEPSRASEAEGSTDEAPASAGDRQRVDNKTAADEPAPDSEADHPSDSEGEPSSGPDHEPPSADQEGFSDLDSQEQAEHRLSQITDRAIERCLAAEGRDAEGNYGEHGLTPAMRRIESQLDYGHLADQTEKYALKDPVRFKEKLAERIERFPNADPNDLAAEIHDGVRYTFILDFDHYTDSVGIAQSELVQAGYDQIETKPGWHGEEYKGVNSQWGDPASGIKFEVQFHTSESWSAKQITHESYDAIRSNKVSVKEVESLRAYQREVSATVRIPLGALDIPAYRKGRSRRR
jgi:hypothetical protein